MAYLCSALFAACISAKHVMWITLQLLDWNNGFRVYLTIILRRKWTLENNVFKDGSFRRTKQYLSRIVVFIESIYEQDLQQFY